MLSSLALAWLASGWVGAADASAIAADSPWIRAGVDVSKPVWGLRDGIMVGVWPGSVEGAGRGGPRGLIRVGCPLGEPRAHRLVNFIAIEPDVGDGKWRGLSELERSDLDGVPGKRIWAEMPEGSALPTPETALPPGALDHPPDDLDAERLRVCLRVERFANGAHPYLMVTLRTDRPNEVMLETFHEPDSVPMRECVLTATMGNYARLRRATLADGVIADALRLWPSFGGNGFAPFRSVRLDRLARASDGSVIVPMECDETDPSANWPHDPGIWWRWKWEKVTHYWRKPAGTFSGDLDFAANGRAEYWGSGALTVPGGVAFENTELRSPYEPGGPFCFGVTHRAPAEVIAGP